MFTTWSVAKKQYPFYRTSSSGCFWILCLFSFRIEEGRRAFEEEESEILQRDIEETFNNIVQKQEQVAVSSTVPVVKTFTSSCSSGKIQTSNENRSSGSRKWANKEIIEIIDTWEEEEALFNVIHPDYSIKEKRNNALDRVRMQLESAGICATTTEIRNKLHSLRVYYSSQRNKLEY